MNHSFLNLNDFSKITYDDYKMDNVFGANTDGDFDNCSIDEYLKGQNEDDQQGFNNFWEKNG